MRRAPGEPSERSGYLASDTIAALASGLGGAIAVIRVSGPQAIPILETITRKTADALAPRALGRARIFDSSGEPLDEALVVTFPGPGSFTGEDVVELHLHGGALTPSRVLRELLALGARQALPGEFSFRAVRNGKMSLDQAQAVADLISASNPSAANLALEKISGTQNRLLRELAESIRRLSVFGEVGIDFADQNVEEVSLPALKKRVDAPFEVLSRLRDSYNRGQLIQDGVRVALLGRPNSGKSSFFNTLLGEDRSIVSPVAGTTRDVVREQLTLGTGASSVTLRLEDTAGLRTTRNTVEGLGIDRSRRSAQAADLVLFLVDPTQRFETARSEWEALLAVAGQDLSKKTIGILTKRDLISPSETEKLRALSETLGVARWVPTSAQSGEGISEAVQEIISFCGSWTHREKGEVLLTRLEHFQAATEALEHLSRAKNAPELDLFAADLRQALHALGPLIGETLPDDILGQIFSDFCIGK